MKKSTRLNILFAIIILLAAGVLWLCFGHPAAGSGLVAVLTYGDGASRWTPTIAMILIPAITPSIWLWKTAASALWKAPARTTPVNPLAY